MAPFLLESIMPGVSDIVFAPFPCEETTDKLVHPCLVIDCRGGNLFEVAYGSSKRVCVHGHLDSELVISDQDEMAACGLVKPTRFDLGVRATIYIHPSRAIAGSLPGTSIGRLYRAAKHCKLI